MDLNDEYLRMILALSNKFFEGWEFNDGDQVYLIEEIDDYSPSKDHGLYTVFDGLLADDGFLNTENWLYVSVIDFKNGRPIPSQEQLQDIILKKFHENGLDITDREGLYIFWRLQDWLHGQDFEEMAYLRFECIWLKFLMYLNCKTWNGESWV